MRSKLAAAVRKRFAQRMKQEFPHFKQVKEPTARDLMLFRSDAIPPAVAYIALQMHSNLDWFTLEGAYTKRNRFPADMPPLGPGSPGESGDLRFRLSELWTKPPRDIWWEFLPRPTVENTLEYFQNPPAIDGLLSKVDSLVDDAIERISKHAVPHFERLAPSFKG